MCVCVCIYVYICIYIYIYIHTYIQGSTIIKLAYVITYVCQNFGVRDVRGQIPKNIYEASYLLPSDFPYKFS